MARMNPQETVQYLITQFQANPDSFNDDELGQLKKAADELQIPFDIPADFGRMAKNFAFDTADSALFDLLPDEWGPSKLTTGDTIAGGLGTAAGFFTMPWAIGGKAAGAATKGIARLASEEGASVAARGLENLAAKFGGKMSGGVGYKALIPQAASDAAAAYIPRGAGEAAAAAATRVAPAPYSMAEKALMKAYSTSQGAGRGVTALGGKLAGSVREGAVRKGAEFLAKRPALTGRMVQAGVASGLSGAGTAAKEGDITPIIERTFGGAVAGGLGYGVNSVAKMIGALGPVAEKAGVRQAIKLAAAAIYGNMTAPERSMYPQEYVEEFVKNAILAYR